jgi:hypothetical protein
LQRLGLRLLHLHPLPPPTRCCSPHLPCPNPAPSPSHSPPSSPLTPSQEPELLHTLYTTQGLPHELSELSFEMALPAISPDHADRGGGGGGGGAARDAPSGAAAGRPGQADALRFVAAMERAAAEGRRDGGILAKGAAEFASLVKEQVGVGQSGGSRGRMARARWR